MDLINQTLLYAVSTSGHLAYFLLIKIVAVSNGSITVNATNIQPNGVILNYTTGMPLFLVIYNGSGQPSGEIFNVPVDRVSVPGYTLYVDQYNGLVLSYISANQNFTLNGSTIPIGPGKTLPIILPFQKQTNYTYEVLLLSSVLVLSFYLLFRRGSSHD
ncbi:MULTISPECIES: hypothetical protein [Metallosphaera]|nr:MULTISPECIES: hypothetical protein [Metallosphaera]MCH1770283.1 hypothetical protein [Metallosphaera sedula]MCP6727883.1 hypothetical protein [Metallosphaera sedula]MCY0861592.1 hypothetical protein [Metallosphaera prunae]QCO31058.1 hypothetical protein DFR88_11630 [Metallosphaera prunae]WPX05347.1 hypothetical protein SOJ17_001315 [Metallosphaera sedula DSM 5348]